MSSFGLRRVSCLLLTALALPLAGCAPSVLHFGVVDGAVILHKAPGTEVLSLNASTGESLSRWTHDGAGSAPTTVPTDVFGRAVVLVHGANGVAVRDARTGEITQRIFAAVDPHERPVLSRTAMFLPTWAGENSVWVGFDLQTGRRNLNLRCDSHSPLIANDDILATMSEGVLVGYSADDGRERWRSSLAVERPVLIRGNHLLARLEDDVLGIFVASSGALARKLEPNAEVFGRGLGGAPKLTAWENSLGMLTSEGLTVVDLETGRNQFRHEGAESCVYSGSRVVVSVGTELRGLDAATGATRWKQELGSKPVAVTADARTTLVQLEDALLAVDATSGKKLFTRPN